MFRNEIITYVAIFVSIATLVFIIVSSFFPEKDSDEEKKRITKLNHVWLIVLAGLMLAAILI